MRFVFILILAVLLLPVRSVAEPEKVYVGMYVVNINELDTKAGTYLGDFYVWFRWTGALSPTSFEIMNGTETTKERNYYSVTNGVKYAVYRCQSKLSRVFAFDAFPLDSHELTIEVEDGQHEIANFVYVADTLNSKVHPDLRLAGWQTGPGKCHVRLWTYPTNYGDPAQPPDYKAGYSRFVMAIPIKHEGLGVYLKAFLPLFISVAIALLALFVPPDQLEVRVGLAVAGVFGAVSSQLVVAGNLPETPTLTLSDKVHIASLSFVFLTLVVSCISFTFVSKEKLPQAARIDRFARLAIPLAYIAAIIAVSVLR